VVSDSALIARLALASVIVALFPATARADTFAVTTAVDDFAVTGCTPVACTLRSAITAATGNGNATDDVIVIPAGQYVISAQAPLGVGSSATRITLQGAGANSTFVQPQAGSTTNTFTAGPNTGVNLNDLTLRNGNVTTGVGGNLWVQNGATVGLNRVRVTAGSAPQGAGIAVQTTSAPATRLNIASSLIDGNVTTGTATTAAGGGIYATGQTGSSIVSIQDSTITRNDARTGGGIYAATTVQLALRGVTLARNNARAGTGANGVGGVITTATSTTVEGSIIGANTMTPAAAGPLVSDCSFSTAAVDGGGNVTPAGLCGLGGSHADPLLASELDDSQPPALAIPANSPAVDIAPCGTRTVDQRGVARPQLNGCDAGAFEYQPPPPEPTPTPTPTATPTPVPTVTPTPTPPPVRNQSVGASTVSGRVLVKLPGSTRFVPLDPSVIKNGAEVDARTGKVQITTSSNEKATFYDGIFKISQSGGITTLTLTEQLAPCPSRKARAAAKKPKTRKLWGDGKGKFRTKGKYSAATIRGTRWLVQDGCRYTRTTVAVGSVSVRDDVKKKTFIVRKGKSYTARPRR
jgi:hypothetical protein